MGLGKPLISAAVLMALILSAATVYTIATGPAVDFGWIDRTFSNAPQVAPFGAFADGLLPPALDNPDGAWAIEEAYPHLAFESPMAVAAQPGSDRLWVAERAGRLWHFDDLDHNREKTLALDISARTWDGVDSGLLDFTFHPDFAKGRRWLFATYIAGSESQADDRRFRLSRFEVGTDGTLSADGEVILIDQIALVDQHRGGSLAFDNSGLLYVGIGDLGSKSRVQRLRDSFRGCVLRIDVDQDPSRSDPLGDELIDRGKGLWTGAYGIPHDNPKWLPEDRRHLPEYYAAGLRNPHRLTFDPQTGVLLAADVGTNETTSREELNRIVPGGNYGWPFRESDRWLKPQPGVFVGKLTDPVFSYDHQHGDRCVIGGFIYRGDRWLSLRGHYLYGDYSSGRFWAQEWNGNDLVEQRTLLGRLKGLVGFGMSSRGEVLCVSLRESQLHRLVPNDASHTRPLPARLSETGLLTLDSHGELQAHPGLVRYSINNSAWHDGAEATRWIGVPTNGWRNRRSEQIQAHDEQLHLELPIGSVVVKHLALADEKDGARNQSITRHHVETQVIVRGEHGHYGAAYRWNDQQSDAVLVTDSSHRLITPPTGGETAAPQPWTHHGVQSCAACHRENDGYLLAMTSRQLSGPPPGRPSGSQLRQWLQSSLLNDLSATAIDTVADATSFDDPEAPASDRLRAWLDVNCSQCHQNDRSNRTTFDLRFAHSSDWYQVLTKTPSVTDPQHGHALIVAGSPENSMVWQRIQSTGGDAMPPLGRHRADQRMVKLLGQFIAAQPETSAGLADGTPNE